MYRFYVRLTHGECPKMYFTLMSIEGLIFPGRGRDFTQIAVEEGVSGSCSFDFKFNVPLGF